MNDVYEIIENSEETDDAIFVLVVHGFAPEFYSGIAFRTDKSYKPQRRKDISCPHCGRKFETVDATVRVEVFRYSKNSEGICHNFRHCRMCHKAVGIKFA